MGVCVQECGDGHQARCRICSAVVAVIFLFIGITMQFWSGSHVDDIPLSKLCEAYTGSGDWMKADDYREMMAWYGDEYGFQCDADQKPDANGKCEPNFLGIAGFFLRSNRQASFTGRTDLMRYADVAFYCKHTPNQVPTNKSITCMDSCPPGSGSFCNPFPCRLWPDQPYTPKPSNWYLSESLYGGGAVRHVNCGQKAHVFEDFLEAVYGQSSYAHTWGDEDVKAASREFYLTCLVDKGNNGYILNIGPIISTLGGVITVLTLFRRFHGPPWPEVGINLLILSLILILFGFWSISIGTVAEISNYAICGDTPAPVTFRGMRYDGRPCVDRDTMGDENWNPFVYQLSIIYSTYVVGGVLTFLSIVMFLGLITGFTEKMMGDRFGKYLMSVNDMPNIKLPFPHHHTSTPAPAPAPAPAQQAKAAPSFGGAGAKSPPGFGKAPPSFGGQAATPQWGGQAGTANVNANAAPPLDANLLPDGGPNEMQKTNVGTVMFNPLDSMAGRSLDKYGEFMRDELELLKQVVRTGDYVVDAGAMYGTTSLGLAKVVGDQGAVYAFEPQRVLHQLLCSNFAMNGAFHAHCRQEALGAQEGEVVVPAVDITKQGCHGCTALDATNYLGETVKMLTVDGLNLMKLRLLKADVEGMELDIVKGATKTINMFKPALYVRAHYTPEDNTLSPKTQELARYIQTLNYDMYWHFVRLYQADNFYGNSDNVYGEDTILYILAVPHVDGSTIEGLEPVQVPPA